MLHDQNLEKQLEKQIGCMTGFLQLFDRHQILTGKRRLPASLKKDADLESESQSPLKSELESEDNLIFSSDPLKKSPANELESSKFDDFVLRSDRSSSVTDFKKLREAPRLSLDSRATLDGKGSLCAKQIHSNASISSDEKQRRSPSVIARLMGLEHLPNSHPPPKDALRRSASESRVSRDYIHYGFVDKNTFSSIQTQESKLAESKAHESHLREWKEMIQRPGTPLWKSPRQRKNSFDSNESFPGRSSYDEEIDDIEALKEVVEALQLKGLLHYKNTRRNSTNGSPIVVMKPLSLSTPASLTSRRSATDFYPRACRHLKFQNDSTRIDMNRTRSRAYNEEYGKKSSRSPVLTGKHSSRISSKSTRNPRRRSDLNRNEDESSTSTSDCMMADVKEGRYLLERCDKLLHSIAEMTSPVSVLDPFYKDESLPYPKEEEDDEVWNRSVSLLLDESKAGDDDYIYIAEILQAGDSNVIPNTRSTMSKARKKLVFDAVMEILQHKRQLPPWEASAWGKHSSLPEVWPEFEKLRRVESSGDLFGDGVKLWRNGLEMSELVLDLERQIFKDLVTDSVLHLASHAARIRAFLPRRRLVF